MHQQDRTYKFNICDIVILLFAAVVFMTYPYGENLSPEFLLFFIQMVLLWFILKTIYRVFPELKTIVLIGLLIWGVIEAVWGLGQLYNHFPAKHSLFKTTGSFLNPGPFGGLIALMCPLALHHWLLYRYKNIILANLYLFAGTVCLIVLPATLSRTAWIAAIVGCLFVLVWDRHFILKLFVFWRRRKNQCILYSIMLCIFLTVSVYGIYHLKKDSADGRLFMWKITTLAILDSPIKGSGLGGFPAAYAQAQMEYFKNGNGSETEKLVAGSPEYAFNEYLQIFLEQGLFGFILFLLLSFLIIKGGIRNNQTGAAGSFIGLSVFALASYPYHLWQFPVVWVLLGTVCTTGNNRETCSKKQTGRGRIIFSILLVVVLGFASTVCISRQKVIYKAKKEWKRLQPFYTMKAYDKVVESYDSHYAVLNFDQKFMFEYGMILNATNQRVKANGVFSRGLEISCDPMFYNVKGRNYHEMKEYKKAEEYYTHSIELLPERIYPYYLLTRLYADPANYQPDKMWKAAQAVLEKEPKVHSMAIHEMREEVNKILKEKEFINER